MSLWKIFSRGIIEENPYFVLALSLCPGLAVTTSVINGLTMGLTVWFVITCNNVVVSIIRKTINKDNVYKFIYDLLDVGVNPIGEFEKPICYRLEKEEVDYFASDEFLWGILKRSSPKNNSQRFILEIFQKHINSDQPLMEKMMSDNFFSKDL